MTLIHISKAMYRCENLSIIAAICENGAIGANNQLLCRLPNDLKRFKQLTTGHTVIMGRKTFESLPKGALPNRTNVVISRNEKASFAGCETYHALQTAIKHHQHEKEIFIIGGAAIYEQAIDIADKLYITFIHHSFDHADAFFPVINDNDWMITDCGTFPSDENHLFSYTFNVYKRKNRPE